MRKTLTVIAALLVAPLLWTPASARLSWDPPLAGFSSAPTRPAYYCLPAAASQAASEQAARPRGRDLGVPFDGTTGLLNAITDVAGVTVGHSTIIRGDGPLKVGVGPVRTGVTAVLPRGRDSIAKPSFAGWFSLNGNGEMTGTTWVEESGFLEGPVMITNTHSVGVVRDGVIKWRIKSGPRDASGYWWSLPVVAETYDGVLNDINGMHVKEEHAFEALDSARGGAVQEGNVGGGTGMICYGFKGGIGTASRKLSARAGGYIVGVLVQANFGARGQLRIAGVPIGRELQDTTPKGDGNGPQASGSGLPSGKENGAVVGAEARRPKPEAEFGSIIVVVATDAPLMPHQLKRIARRVPLGLARTGSISSNGSGDIFIAFSTANLDAFRASGLAELKMVSNEEISPLFEATAQATEEAIVNALVAAETMVGANNVRVEALPHGRLQEVLRKYNRLVGR